MNIVITGSLGNTGKPLAIDLIERAHRQRYYKQS